MASIERLDRSRRDSKQWCVRYRDVDGKSRRKYFDRKVDAQRFAASVETDKDRGEFTDPRAGRVLFGPWAEEWLATKRGLKPATVDDYRRLLDCHVLPVFADVPLHRIERVHVEQWLAGLEAKGLGASRARKSFVVLSSVLDAAVEHGKLVRNPARARSQGRAGRVSLPRQSRPARRYLTVEQVRALAEAAPQPVVVYTLAYSGARFSELVALRREDCDLLRRRITLDENATEVAGELVWQPSTKTDAVVRPKLPAFVCDLLARHLETVPPDAKALVFTGADGGPMRYRNWLRYVWRPAVAAAGLDGLTPHELRHTCASLLIAQGADPKTVQAQLGHTSIATTFNVYGHLFDDHADDVFDRLDAAGRAARVPDVSQQAGRVVSLQGE